MSKARELCQDAALLMRERALAATPAPWTADTYAISFGKYTGRIAIKPIGKRRWLFSDVVRGADVDYVASMAPPVAIAIADWLDSEVSIADTCDCEPTPDAVKVAIAYLAGD
jgi:hypothetical protein